MTDVPPELAAEFERCIRKEKLAWKAVGGNLPGTLQHDRKAWFIWVECSKKTDRARRRVESAILSQRLHTAPAANDSTPDAVTDGTSQETERLLSEGTAEAICDVASQPIPLSAAPEARHQFSSIVQAAGFHEAQFLVTLLRLGPGELSDGSYIVTVACSRLGLSRTYESATEYGWLAAFEQDLSDGLFPSGDAVADWRAASS
jgi:hypothetical protein